MKDLTTKSLKKYNQLILLDKNFKSLNNSVVSTKIKDIWAFKLPKFNRLIENRIKTKFDELWGRIEILKNDMIEEEIDFLNSTIVKYYIETFSYIQVISLFHSISKYSEDKNSNRYKKVKVITPTDDDFEKIIQIPFLISELMLAIINNDITKLKELISNLENKNTILQSNIKIYQEALDDKKSNERNKDREIENAQNIIRTLRSRNVNKIDYYTLPSLIQKYREGKLQSHIIDDIKKYLSTNAQLCLKKNGQISYNRLKNLLGVSSNKTAQNWCQLFGIR